ncbi:phenylalanine--tRNA ligase subunit beta [Candidatus Saccharibacteria bacterium]|nr:phenylalanine--tRNA ligase subunit beta [Candidatus Saccharibacteria bacterium]
MKVSVNWIREINKKYQCSADPMPKGIDALVEKIGSQLGAVEEVVDVGKKYRGVVVAKVVSCEKHPNADKLSVCMIDDGGVVKKVRHDSKGLVQVVCGAPNVKAGQMVAWIPPGQTVPVTIDKDPMVLEAREIRGKVSNGMIASLKELSLGDDHTGILVIDQPAKPGQPFAEVYGLDDYIIDIENKMFTHRPDCFGMLGIARELAGIQGMVFRSPNWYLGDKTISTHKTDNQLLSVKNQVPMLVPRFMMQIVKNVKVGPSSLGIQAALARVAVRPINNIVDITNYLMLETAQPLHAYDYDKVKALSATSKAQITVRMARRGEKLKILGGKEVTLGGQEVVIATDRLVLGLGGVMGGADTEVDENTKNIILEVGNFDMNATRKTAMTHGLFTDAATRFTKNQSPWQNDRVLARAIDFVIHESGGLPARSVYDLKSKLAPPSQVKTKLGFINDRLGLNLSATQTKQLLENVEFKVEIGSDDSLRIIAPFWRTDIVIPEDIVEEIGRLYGYDHLPLKLPTRDHSPAKLNQSLVFKNKIRQILSSAGANEVLTYSFVDSSLIQKAGQNTKDAYHIRNALSPDLQYYRLSLAPSLLEKIHTNVKEGFDKFVLFELGRTHIKGVLDEEKLPKELDRLALVATKNYSNQEEGAPYFAAKKQLENLLHGIGIYKIRYEPIDSKLDKQWKVTAQAYEPKRSAIIYHKDEVIGLVGEPTQVLKQILKLPSFTAQAEIDINALLMQTQPPTYYSLNRFPSVEQDLCLRTSINLGYSQLTDFILKSLGDLSKGHGYTHWLRTLDIYQKPGDKKLKQTTWHVVIAHPDRTLTTAEVNTLLDKVAAAAKVKFKAERV